MFIDGAEITDLTRIKAFKKKYRRAMQNAMLLTDSSRSEHLARQRIEHNPALKAEHQEEALRALDGLL